jgi:hypothetical protein
MKQRSRKKKIRRLLEKRRPGRVERKTDSKRQRSDSREGSSVGKDFGEKDRRKRRENSVARSFLARF